MYYNPFSSWVETGQEQPPSFWGQGIGSCPPVFGALPTPPPPPNPLTFYFTSSSPDIFNANVTGHQGQLLYRVVTDHTMQGYTIIKNIEGRNIILIEWARSPFVEIRGVLAKQHVRHWLKLSNDGGSRQMNIRGLSYFWAPRDKFIFLTTGPVSNPTFLARVDRTERALILDLCPQAIQLGLLDSIIAATFLLQCGCNID